MKINEIIEERMRYRGINQTEICKECGMNIQNFNSFLKGNRKLPKSYFIKVMGFLSYTFKKDGEAPVLPDDIETTLVADIKNSGDTATKIASQCNVSVSTLSCILNGKRQMTTDGIMELSEYFGYKLVII